MDILGTIVKNVATGVDQFLLQTCLGQWNPKKRGERMRSMRERAKQLSLVLFGPNSFCLWSWTPKYKGKPSNTNNSSLLNAICRSVPKAHWEKCLSWVLLEPHWDPTLRFERLGRAMASQTRGFFANRRDGFPPWESSRPRIQRSIHFLKPQTQVPIFPHLISAFSLFSK